VTDDAAAQQANTVCDMMAGIGPFAVPLAKGGFVVHANDLNPHSYKHLVANAAHNGAAARLHAANLCGREFFQDLLDRRVTFGHVIMNLPARLVLVSLRNAATTANL
jgi:tRNA (guanine37-N1)-methyltransferase